MNIQYLYRVDTFTIIYDLLIFQSQVGTIYIFSWIHSNVYHFIFPLCTPCIPWLQHNWRKHNWFEYREILSDSETFKLWILCKLSVLDIWRIEGKISFLVETLTMWTKKEKTIKLMIKNLLHLLKSPANSKNI